MTTEPGDPPATAPHPKQSLRQRLFGGHTMETLFSPRPRGSAGRTFAAVYGASLLLMTYDHGTALLLGRAERWWRGMGPSWVTGALVLLPAAAAMMLTVRWAEGRRVRTLERIRRTPGMVDADVVGEVGDWHRYVRAPAWGVGMAALFLAREVLTDPDWRRWMAEGAWNHVAISALVLIAFVVLLALLMVTTQEWPAGDKSRLAAIARGEADNAP